MRYFLALNYGSSSLKYAFFDENLREIRRGNFVSYTYEDFKKSIFELREQIFSIVSTENLYLAHRFVHGAQNTSPLTLNDENLKILEKLVELNPLHNKISFFCIQISLELFPLSKHFAIFDTDFHRSIPPEAQIYGLDLDLYKEGIRKYGFHGISYSYILRRIKEILGKQKPNIIALHLGSGSSACVIKEGVSIETSMGFSPLEGLIMSTRPGDVDPGLIVFLIEKGMSADQIKNYLYYSCGIKGLCGTKDFRELIRRLKDGDKTAELAFRAFVQRILKYVGYYWILIEGDVDALVFSGGIGENSPEVRYAVCEKLRKFGVVIDQELNSQNTERISDLGSKVGVFVIRTNEELEMILKILESEDIK
ncbi:MAG: acetate/propionate family kinase [Candidatus Calescibacterium sp.]|nr:acetate/propionate family kinase [Candidatus Calescibacterium sp.]MCX7734616.1 acetate/propionate family kinase [bacterium]MDW8087031.1 acetate/propionate family kinase [Candidatus Calescibacterium sp.]